MADYKRLGDYIVAVDERNSDLSVTLSQGINNNKYFQQPRQVAENSKNDKIVRYGYFAYNRATTRNGDKISIAYREGEDCTVSAAYQVFYIKDEELLNPHYLLLWFKRPTFDRYARFKSHGSAHEFFEWDEMCNVMLPVPPIEEQRRIVEEYQTVERRIKNNERLIALLEDTAQTIFRHRFVDNIDPNNLPEGWEMGIIGDLGEIVSGATPKTEISEYWCDNCDDGVAWISPADLSLSKSLYISKGRKNISVAGYNSCSTKIMPANSILFSSRAPIGLIAISARNVCTNQGFKSVILKNPIEVEFAYMSLKVNKDAIAREGSGSTFDEISLQIFKNYPILLPPTIEIGHFHTVVKPIFEMIGLYQKENSLLSETKDMITNKL